MAVTTRTIRLPWSDYTEEMSGAFPIPISRVAVQQDTLVYCYNVDTPKSNPSDSARSYRLRLAVYANNAIGNVYYDITDQSRFIKGVGEGLADFYIKLTKEEMTLPTGAVYYVEVRDMEAGLEHTLARGLINLLSSPFYNLGPITPPPSQALSLALGGTGANLALEDAGLVYKPGSGNSPLETLGIGAGLSISNGDLVASGGGGGTAIGGDVTGGTAGLIPYIAAGPVLAQNAGLAFDPAATVPFKVVCNSTSKVAAAFMEDGGTNNSFEIGYFAGGGGGFLQAFNRNSSAFLPFYCAGNTITFSIGNSPVWQINASGHFKAVTDNTNDIGASGANRPRNVYVGTSVVTPLVVIAASAITTTGVGAGTIQVQGGTNQVFRVGGAINVSGAVTFTGTNDANTANCPGEFRFDRMVIIGGTPSFDAHEVKFSGFSGTNPVVTFNNGINAKSIIVGQDNSTTVFIVADGGVTQVIVGNSTQFAKVGGAIFDHYTDGGSVGTAETTLATDTIAANTLATNGDKIEAKYGIQLVNSASTKQLKLYFAGSAIWVPAPLTMGGSESGYVVIDVLIERSSSTAVRYTVTATFWNGGAISVGVFVEEVTGLTLSGSNILKVTGTAAGGAAADNDLVCKLASVKWSPAA